MKKKLKIQSILKNIDQENLNRLSEEQLDFILHPNDSSCFLRACPGSGKTEVVGIKAAYEIANWKLPLSGMAILSFTKNAAKEISERVVKYYSINSTKHPHFISTIDAWLHSFILHPFGHSFTGFQGREGDKSFILVNSNDKFDFLTSFQTPHNSSNGKPYPIEVNNYYFNHRGEIEGLKQDVKSFHESKLDILKTQKINCLKAGISTYQDAEYMCLSLLGSNPHILENLAKRFPVLIIDECQDLSQCQLRLLHLLKEKGVNLFFIGDINQAIYEFRKVDVEKILGFINHHKFEVKLLTSNYRSNNQIVDVCQNLELILNGGEKSAITGQEPQILDNNVFLWEYENVKDLPSKFIDFIKERNTEIKKEQEKKRIPVEEMKGFVSVEKSVILGRGHSLLSSIRPDRNNALNKIQLFANSLNCWNLYGRTGKDMQNALQQLGKSICILAYGGKGNYQEQYCPEGITPLVWRNFLNRTIEEASKTLYPFQEVTWSKWAGLLKEFLKNHWNELPIKGALWENVKKKIKGSTKEKVIDQLKLNPVDNSNKIRISTFHGVKGETLDAALVVSSKNNQGTKTGRFFKDWISSEEKCKEFVRFAYVASSRPKHLLIWAIPKQKDNSQIEILEKMGFKKTE